MRRLLAIPEEVKESIRKHLNTAIERAQARYEFSSENEDAVTGALGMSLHTGLHTVFVARSQVEIPGTWKWSLRYHKFRSTGPMPTEHSVGADGVFELTLDIGTRRDQKSLLFQAKQEGEGGRSLFEQAMRLTTWREAAFVLVYSATGYRAVSVDHAIARRGRVERHAGDSLIQYLGQDFLNCDVGDSELQYDGQHKRLVWRAMNGEIVATPFRAKHRMAVKVEAPRFGEALPGIDRVVQNDEIHEFRMQANESDILNLKEAADSASVKRAKKRLALIFHPDRLNDLDPFYQNIGKREMQTINSAADRLRQKTRK